MTHKRTYLFNTHGLSSLDWVAHKETAAF